MAQRVCRVVVNDDEFSVIFQCCQGNLIAVFDMTVAHHLYGGVADADCHGAAWCRSYVVMAASACSVRSGNAASLLSMYGQ
ncbi:hypothetical protein [Vreelandella neptunia]|uniref:Uncharacterized protein n=1 Tax=Vreelandella neptunia TaxID=115551 RepID=A0ABZ0YQT4_9GAMM|nr:hypothetical protein [Halomonas neptunia]MDN3558700.1 hypothetical protein [Halomonas neptunia]TDV92165.1 hypothetical protein BDK62_11786 [Halomonas alkaliantarctica]WQH13667.1 hypothetical protein SR894_03785 [Halomonas neptunia]